VVIAWDPVTRSHPELGRTDESIDVVGYQLVVEEEDLVYSVELTPDVTELEVPPSFTARAWWRTVASLPPILARPGDQRISRT
jgi:hypothetical protein